ncbi:MAG: primosomal protein N', partial [Clostridium sp.]|nr:primosomal protein N' [Clostridium sp.]
MNSCYADVIIDISHEKVDRPFQYRIPERLRTEVAIGVCVTVPFGMGNTLRNGYVVGFRSEAEYDPDKIKEIAGVKSGSTMVQSQLIRLAWWMKNSYGCTMNQALKTVLPVREKVKEKEKKMLRCLLSPDDLETAIGEAERKKYRARVRLLKAFRENPIIPMDMARGKLQITEATVKPMVEQGQAELLTRRVSRTPLPAAEQKKLRLTLNKEQQAAADRFREDYREGLRKKYLLYGITGSGKTEVYMEMMEEVLSRGQQVILLIPEIALTYQTVMRFYNRFGDRIAVLNSRLSAGERYDQWERAVKGEVSVMIGPRSALFAPFSNLGLIIMDEEHEGAYKSETMPRYHAREVAEKRAEDSGAALVLGSATPSLESYTKARRGEYELLELKQRAVLGSHLSKVEIVDLRRELLEGNKSMFSRCLRRRMEERLEKNEQIMLFINRRGYSNFVSCRSCGEAVKCPHCDVSLTLHGRGMLVCHYCGYTVPMMKTCPSCGSPYLAGFGAGTQKLEELTHKEFPGARVLRMDADTTARKGGHEAILSAFAAHEADILIGTQMIVKGHDFPRVTLVGIMAADLSLNTPDYRCAERSFQLMTQAAGRAGRGSREGTVVIQTYQPDHYAIRAAAAQDYEAFYQREYSYRKLMDYPPACRMQMILFASSSEELLEECGNAVLAALTESIPAGKARFIGPVQAPIYKVNDIYRKILYIKSEKCDI